MLSSFSRHCENCLERRVTRKDQAGRKIEEIQYYHRAVAVRVCIPLDSPLWRTIRP